jgi:aminoglycoside/choline kinase family phosphotransferase
MELFSAHFGSPPTEVRNLAADGSSRSYCRLVGADARTAIGGIGPDPAENRAFLSFSRSLRDGGLKVPEIYGADEASGVWLMQDLGDTSLFTALEDSRHRTGDRFAPEIETWFRQVAVTLPGFQIQGGRVVDFDVAYPRSDFDAQSILWDLNYFKYHFLKLAQIPFDEAALEEDFHRLAQFLLRAEGGHFLHRDLQSRNIMLQNREPWFIDYQGGRRGPLQYDVASLLCSATTDIPPAAQTRLLEVYLDALENEQPVDRARWKELYRGFVLIRLMQAMGAYGFRGFFERRPRFVASIPNAARSLRNLLEEGMPVEMGEVASAFGRIVERWAEEPARSAVSDTLSVRLSSFSYRRGYPSDSDEHGGGFVFDCRALPNPGREEEYRLLTGLDVPVQEHLQERPEVSDFWENTRRLVEAQVENYRMRDFRNLAVAYGCTGGQHRSVYLTERMAAHLRERFPDVQIEVTHRERVRWPGHSGTGGDSDWTQ